MPQQVNEQKEHRGIDQNVASTCWHTHEILTVDPVFGRLEVVAGAEPVVGGRRLRRRRLRRAARGRRRREQREQQENHPCPSPDRHVESKANYSFLCRGDEEYEEERCAYVPIYIGQEDALTNFLSD